VKVVKTNSQTRIQSHPKNGGMGQDEKRWKIVYSEALTHFHDDDHHD
jgi:uncharacterized membrane protein